VGHAVARFARSILDSVARSGPGGLALYALELIVVGALYLALTKLGVLLATLQPAMVSLPAGFALAAILLCGLRVSPAILAGALLAPMVGGATPIDSTSLSVVAAANTVEALLGGYVIKVWSDGRHTFDTAAGVAKFALVTLGLSAPLGAAIAAGGASLAGQADGSNLVALGATWWLGHAAGALVVTPCVVLWAVTTPRTFAPRQALDFALALIAAAGVGLVVFSPWLAQSGSRSTLAFLAILPLAWSALRCGPRETATVAAVLACFVGWGMVSDTGPFASASGSEAVLLPIMLMICASVASLVWSADLAERQRFETRLRLQEQNLRAMFSRAAVGVAQLEVGGSFRLVNNRYCELVRRPATELLQMQLQQLSEPEDLPELVDQLARAIKSGEATTVESRFLLPDGTHAWVRHNVAAIVDRDGAVRHLVAMAEDVTARRLAEADLKRAHDELELAIHERTATLKKATEVLHAEIEQRKRVEAALKLDIAERRKTQDELTQSEWRFRLFIQGVTDYAIFMLDHDGCITDWNLGAQRIHQYTAAEIVGQHFSRFYTEEEQKRGEPARALQVAAYEGKYVVEGWRTRRDDSQFWASVLIEAIRDEVGTLVGFAQITRDITERREAQASLERAQEQLAQSQKMEALGQLTGSIAHDFNNLLMIVSGHAQLLRRRLSDPKHLQAIEAVNSAANRGESLTRQLLAFSRRQPINPVVVDLKERIDAVHEMLVGSLRGNVQLMRDIPAEVWPVEVDIAELELALVNITVNARDAMPGGGSITLSARNVTLKKSHGVDQLEGDFVALAMTDTGVGIAPDVLPRIFEPFFTTKALGKGTGLGLAQVYGFSHQSGGTVVATSTVGVGTAITIYLPRKPAAAPVKNVEAPSVQPTGPGQGTVLVVEDNAEVADVTASLVEQLGYRTLRADNASDVLNRLQRGERVDLVFSDVVMPGGMNGIALAQEISNHYPHIPVLLTSGYSDVVQTASSRFTILRKPFQLAALDKSIREALERGGRRDDGDRVLQFPPRPRGSKRE
jgi:PAS domain S-box-containing protein